MSRKIILLLALLILGLTVGSAIRSAPGVQANGYAVVWWTVDGGGGASDGGPYLLGGTIGQPEAGLHSGGSYLLSGGFWNRDSVAGAPPLENIYLPILLKNN